MEDIRNLMEYNTARDQLLMPEYGRNIQKMIEHVKTIEDRSVRQKYAEGIVKLMEVLNPELKTAEDFHKKLWDHLFIMANYDLDVDCPYPVITKALREAKPEPMPYPTPIKRNKHLGKHLNKVIDLAVEEKDEERQRGFTNAIAYYMKLAYSNWHNEVIHDDMIREELKQITDGKLTLQDAINVRTRIKRGRAKQTSRRPNHRNQRGGNPRQNNHPRQNRNNPKRRG